MVIHYYTVCPFCVGSDERAEIRYDRKTGIRIMRCDTCGYFQKYDYRRNTMVVREKVWRQTRIC
jgi:Zn ribbon nucleic-acid-binding protein